MNKPRKKYRPKPVNPLAHIVAMQGAALLTRNDVIRCSLNVHSAVEAVRQGIASKQQWQDLFMSINIMKELVRMGRAEGQEAIDAMQLAVVGILDRQRETGTRAVRADELAMLRDVAATYADLMANITHSELATAHERTRARMKRVLSTGAPDVRVITAPEGIE